LEEVCERMKKRIKVSGSHKKQKEESDCEIKQLQFECENPNCKLKIYINLLDDTKGRFPLKIKCICCGKKQSIKKRIFKMDVKEYKDYSHLNLSRICKKTRDKIKAREKDETKKQKALDKIKKEVSCAIDNKLCPYCATETIGIYSFRGIRYKCYDCNRVFHVWNDWWGDECNKIYEDLK